MSDHIERRRNLWYATLTIPVDARGKLGKLKFIRSLGTPSKHKALILAPPVIAGWKALIRRARGEGDAVVTEALRWRAAIADEAHTFVPAEGFEDIDEPILDLLAREHAEVLEAKYGERVAAKFYEIALGSAVPTESHFESWLADQANLEKKTQDQMRKDVAKLVARFPTLREINHQSIKRWIDELTRKQVSQASQSRVMSFCRSYWKFLQSADLVPSDVQPFNNLVVRKRNDSPGGWLPLSPEEVVRLRDAAQNGGDGQLADLIELGAYTGARIEELCALKSINVSVDSLKIVDAKTDAGIREIPLHSRILPLVERLKVASKDDYLLPGLTLNKYGDRSNAIGKRFGHLKTTLGFGPRHVFHSIRKTLVTLLENAGVSENVTADIVGHKKPRITYGLYSGGASLARKAEALELISYPAFSVP